MERMMQGGCPMCGRMMGGESQGGMMDVGMPAWMMSFGPMAQMMEDMPVIHNLLTNHEKIERQVDDSPGGIRSVTTSADSEVAGWIRAHVGQMKERVEEGMPIRQMDPAFREIFDHHEQIKLEIEEVPGGVRVQETSEDPQVQLLIRQHAYRAVSEFVESGMQRAMQPTPLPEGYREEESSQSQTEMTDDPDAIRSQIQNLQRRLDELERGETSPQQVQQQMPQMCPMCQGMMGGVSATPDREALEQGIQQRIRRLEERIAALEGTRR